MFRHLKYDDARAVDLLLNESNAGTAPGQQGYSGAYAWGHVEDYMKSHASESRLKGAERVFKLLDVLPAPEPPSDLLSRTLARIEEADSGMPFFSGDVERRASDLPDFGSMQPHA